ncbi:hypothetical protein DK37_21285, partial [Halomonas sp. SUBG004]
DYANEQLRRGEPMTLEELSELVDEQQPKALRPYSQRRLRPFAGNTAGQTHHQPVSSLYRSLWRRLDQLRFTPAGFQY